MPSLTIALIVKNESASLGSCLAACTGLDAEILVIDGGSLDDTVQIAQRSGARVISHPEWHGFGRQRQIAQEHITTDWVLWLDADEHLTPTLRASIREAVDADKPQTVYEISRLSWVFGRFIRHSGWYPDRVVRLYPTALTRYNDAPVHEHVIVPADVAIKTLAGDLEHYTYRDLQHYLVKSAHYAHLWAQQRLKLGKRSSLSQGVIHAAGCFLRMYVLKAGFLDGRQGLLLALLSAHSTFAKYADLWVKRQPPAG
jgi:(heptosyl)LPS beta-1,4-glucosyltransferase